MGRFQWVRSVGVRFEIGKGEGLRFLSGRILSPSYRAVKASVLKAYPQAKWVEYDPFAPENVLEGTNIAFGQPLTPHYVFDKASVVLSLDSDFLGSDSGTVRPAKLWTKNRHLYEGETELNRLYAVESRHSLTGMNADHRRRLRSTEIPGFAVDLEAALEGQSPAGSAATFIWWAGAISYPIVVGGKPLFAFTFSIPIMFELMILFSAFGSLFGMLGINGLPQFYHSIFNYTESDRISDDGFVLAIESGDPQFDALECVSVLEAAGATSAEVVAK